VPAASHARAWHVRVTTSLTREISRVRGNVSSCTGSSVLRSLVCKYAASVLIRVYVQPVNLLDVNAKPLNLLDVNKCSDLKFVRLKCSAHKLITRRNQGVLKGCWMILTRGDQWGFRAAGWSRPARINEGSGVLDDPNPRGSMRVEGCWMILTREDQWGFRAAGWSWPAEINEGSACDRWHVRCTWRWNYVDDEFTRHHHQSFKYFLNKLCTLYTKER
jgi:hypothetical protein